MKFEKIQRAFERENKCIILSSDEPYIPITTVAIQSIIEQRKAENNYDIIILHDGVSEEHKRVVEGMAIDSNVSIRFYDVRSIFNNIHTYTANRKDFSSSAYYRLVIPYILDEYYEKALYIDGDMVLQEDVYKIFDYDLGNNLIAAVKDYWGICNCYIEEDPRRKYRESIGLPDIDSYVISATIIFNNALYRDTYKIEQILELIGSFDWVQHDQDVLNILCKNSIMFISPTWGYMTDYGNNHYLPHYLQEELEDVVAPAILHFGGRRKPTTTAYVDNDEVFWKVARKTPFFEKLLNSNKSLEYKIYVVDKLCGIETSEKPNKYVVKKYYNSVGLGNLTSGRMIYRRIEIKKDRLILEGHVDFFWGKSDSKVEIEIDINGKKFPVKKHYVENGYFHPKKITTSRGESFIFEIDLESLKDEKDCYRIKIVSYMDGMLSYEKSLRFDKFCSLKNVYKNAYYASGNWIVTTDGEILKIQKCTRKMIKSFEKAFQKELYDHGYTAEKKAVFVRRILPFLKKMKRKPVWLISDRLMKADENGEFFFRYMNEHKRNEVNAYYVISASSPDFKRMKQYGKVVAAYSYRHKMIHLLADILVSSQTDNVFRNPFRNYSDPYSDILYNKPFVWLQHGIISNDLSRWFSRKEQNLSGFVTSTKREYRSILDGAYNYSKDEVWLTGLPRFDYLKNCPKKIITILPTWRLWLTAGQNRDTGLWNLKKDFYHSDYATFYRNLMNNDRLNQFLKEKNYKIQFKVHPCFYSHEKEFGFGDDVILVPNDKSYREIYSESDLIVTDYSSAIYDFIYMKKPIFYTHFDQEMFFSGKHSYDKGDMVYERDGFGEVEYTLEDTIHRIMEYVNNDCQLKDIYRKRINKFFAFNDKNNCQRVYQKVVELEARNG